MVAILDLRQGFGEFEKYSLTKFPDGSIKFKITESLEETILYDDGEDYVQGIAIFTTFRSSDDILALGLVSRTLEKYSLPISCSITYMMYQQDDRKFSSDESFGLAFIAGILNTYPIFKYSIFHPHSDKVELIENVEIIDNTDLIESSILKIKDMFKLSLSPLVWVIPDAGAFKTQFKQIEKLDHKDFITCMKSRSHATGEITTVVNTEDLKGRDCFIVDDICLGGRTFLNIAEKLKEKNCGKIYLIVSHGVFNHGIDHLTGIFEKIYTTDSICTLKESDKLDITPLVHSDEGV